MDNLVGSCFIFLGIGLWMICGKAKEFFVANPPFSECFLEYIREKKIREKDIKSLGQLEIISIIMIVVGIILLVS